MITPECWLQFLVVDIEELTNICQTVGRYKKIVVLFLTPGRRLKKEKLFFITSEILSGSS